MTVILVFPQSCGGFWGGVTECGLGSTRSTRDVALCCPSQQRSGLSVGGDQVSTTVVDSQSTEAARGSPVVDPILEAPSLEAPSLEAASLEAPASSILSAPADDTAVSEGGTGSDDNVGADNAGAQAAESVVAEVAHNGAKPASSADVTPKADVTPNDVMPYGSKPEPVEVAGDAVEVAGDAVEVAGDAVEVAGEPVEAVDEPTDVAHVTDVAEVADGGGEDDGNPVNIGPSGEPDAPDERPTEVTATVSESDLLLEDPPADAALAPDTIATSAFDAEEPQTTGAWDAADVVTEIYHGHYNQLVRLAVLLVHDVQTAEEVVQDAFEAMHLAWRRLRDSEKALQYLRQTVVNRSRSVLRHRKVVDMHAPKPAPDEPSAEHAALALLERSAVAAALRSLPERQREAIALRYYADFSEADIARAMGISKGAVKSHTARAMSSLKTILSQETP
jgi:RNA polymerase sigma-70 factor (sigma-E family)